MAFLAFVSIYFILLHFVKNGNNLALVANCFAFQTHLYHKNENKNKNKF